MALQITWSTFHYRAARNLWVLHGTPNAKQLLFVKMSGTDMADSDSSSSERSDSQPTSGNAQPKRRQSKSNKPRLTAHQKNTNHKDAENKRRNAIRERFTELSNMVPGCQGQERSETNMLKSTADYLESLLTEQRQLEALAAQRGIPIDDEDRLKDNDFLGPRWISPHMDEYSASKAKKEGGGKGPSSDA